MDNNALEREEAIRLIERFSRVYYSYIHVMTENGMVPFSELGIHEPPIPAFIMSYYFGGNARKWGAILKGSAIPSRLDIACLRCSIGTKNLERMRVEARHLRDAAKGGEPPRWATASLPDAKKPLHRRDGGTYDRDAWTKMDKLLDKKFKNRAKEITKA